MASSTTDQVSTSELIKTLTDVNTSLLDRFVGLMEKLQSELLGSETNAQLQGETEELLRLILQTVTKSVETLLSMQQTLQTRIVESYFPAQD